MVKIYADQTKNIRLPYIEDFYASKEIIDMDKEKFGKMIFTHLGNKGEIRTCYSTFVNHVGRFVREYGLNWYGEEFVVITNDGEEHKYNEKGQLGNWPVGYFA